MPHPHHGFLLIPLIAWVVGGLIHAVVVFLIARKRRVNPWGWTIGTVIPFVGIAVALVFYVATALSILDRLDVLEARRS